MVKSGLAGRQVEDIDKSIQKLRAIYKVHPEWFTLSLVEGFEVPKPKSDKGQNAVDYSVK